MRNPLIEIDAALLRVTQTLADELTHRTGLSCYWLAAQCCFVVAILDVARAISMGGVGRFVAVTILIAFDALLARWALDCDRRWKARPTAVPRAPWPVGWRLFTLFVTLWYVDLWFLAMNVSWVAYAYLVSVLPRPPTARRETRLVESPT